jgi:hypothetical protein
MPNWGALRAVLKADNSVAKWGGYWAADNSEYWADIRLMSCNMAEICRK